MSKVNKNVFEKITEALTTATNELETTNSYLYGIGAELSLINDTLASLDTKLQDFLSKPISVTVDTESLTKIAESTKPKAAEKPKIAYAQTLTPVE